MICKNVKDFEIDSTPVNKTCTFYLIHPDKSKDSPDAIFYTGSSEIILNSYTTIMRSDIIQGELTNQLLSLGTDNAKLIHEYYVSDINVDNINILKTETMSVKDHFDIYVLFTKLKYDNYNRPNKIRVDITYPNCIGILNTYVPIGIHYLDNPCFGSTDSQAKLTGQQVLDFIYSRDPRIKPGIIQEAYTIHNSGDLSKKTWGQDEIAQLGEFKDFKFDTVNLHLIDTYFE